MHVHGNPFDPNLQLDAAYAAAKAQGTAEAERIRKRLLEVAAGLNGESEAAGCVVKLSDDAQQDQPASQQEQESHQGQNDTPETPAETFSDWA
jgi:hypothetical protein